MKPFRDQTLGLRLIAIFKLIKGALLLAVGIGALALLHRDVGELAASLIAALHVDADNRYLNALLAKLGLLDDRRLKEIGAGTFCYAAFMLTEGVGLLRRKRWAEYLTVIATASLIPLEIYELTKRLTATRLVVLVLNLAIVVYLIVRLRSERRAEALPVQAELKQQG